MSKNHEYYKKNKIFLANFSLLKCAAYLPYKSIFSWNWIANTEVHEVFAAQPFILISWKLESPFETLLHLKTLKVYLTF